MDLARKIWKFSYRIDEIHRQAFEVLFYQATNDSYTGSTVAGGNVVSKRQAERVCPLKEALEIYVK